MPAQNNLAVHLFFTIIVLFIRLPPTFQFVYSSITCNCLQKNDSLILKSSSLHVLNCSNPGTNGSSEFCVVKDRNITIRSDKGQSKSVELRCETGIVFINSNVTIIGVTITNCGSKVTPNIVSYIKHYTSLHVDNSTAIALLFLQCRVTFSHVLTKSVFGLAVVSVNTICGFFNDSTFSSSLTTKGNITLLSGNVLVLYNGNHNYNTSSTNVTMAACTFDRCRFINDNSSKAKADFFHSDALLKVLNKRNDIKVKLLINDSEFHRLNCGFSHSIFIKSENNAAITQISHSRFITNINPNSIKKCHNSLTELNLEYSFKGKISTILLMVHNTSFNTHQSIKGMQQKIKMNIKTSDHSSITVKFNNVTFSNNTGNRSGVCMFVSSSFRTQVLLDIKDMKVIGNYIEFLSPVASSSGIITLHGVTCNIKGNSSFNHNHGTVIDAMNTKLCLYDSVFFVNNIGYNGPAISIKGNSRLFFKAHEAILFKNNTANSLGGAIYAVVSEVYKHCAFYFSSTVQAHNNITFVDNRAVEGGLHIYAYPIYNCKLNKTKSNFLVNGIKIYDRLFKFKKSENERNLNISTKPVSIHEYHYRNNSIYPGQNISLCISTNDEEKRRVYASVKFSIIADYVWLSPKDDYIKEDNNNTNYCTWKHLEIYTNTNRSGYLTHRLYVYFPNSAGTKSNIILPVNITKKCPLGFSLYSVLGSCQCSKALQRFSKKNQFYNYNCYIKSQSFPRPTGLYTNGWAGLTANKEFAISATCVVGLCTTEKNLKYFYSVDESTTLLLKDFNQPTNNYSVCAEGLEGPLCGKCKRGLTRVFGSLNCISCSNSKLNYWAIISLLFVGGLASVVVSYTLNLTLSAGTINGVLFYANVVNINLSNLLLVSSTSAVSIAQMIGAMFISILNHSVIVPVCFKDDLSEVWKTGLNLVYPYFLLSIVIIIIIVSRYSTWLSNKTSHSSVQVLVTVVHISISILLPVFFKTFSSELLYTEHRTQRVWLYDGSINFLQDSEHCILAVIVTIAVLPLFSAYTLFLIFGKYLIKYSSKFNLHLRQFYEAIHAPYRVGREQWFAVRLLLLMIICALPLLHNVALEYMYMISGLLVGLFLIGHLLFHPYKTKALNILDNWVVLNLAVAYLAVVIWPNNIEIAIHILVLSIFSILCTSTGILVYHVITVSPLKNKMKNINVRMCCHRLLRKQYRNAMQNSNNYLNPLRFNTGSYYSSCNLREPLIGED